MVRTQARPHERRHIGQEVGACNASPTLVFGRQVETYGSDGAPNTTSSTTAWSLGLLSLASTRESPPHHLKHGLESFRAWECSLG